MNILGLHLFGHHTGAAIKTSDELICISEERLSKKKHDGSFPKLSIQYCLDASNIILEDVDYIIIDKNMGRFEDERIKSFFKNEFYNYDRKKFIKVDHHTLHAYSALTLSGKQNSAILIIDGGGSLISESRCLPKISNCHPSTHLLSETPKISIFRYTGDNLVRIKYISKPPGIASIYTNFTQFLGFGKHDAGKTMGLAAYCKDFSDLFGFKLFYNEESEYNDLEFNYNEYTFDLDILSILLNHEKRQGSNKLPDEFFHKVAGFVQHECERFVLEVVQYTKDITQASTLLYSGGVALNCKANYLLEKNKIFDDYFIYPAASDTGIPLGAVAYGWNHTGNDLNLLKKNNCFYGRIYTVNEVAQSIKLLSNKDYHITSGDDIAYKVADFLSNGFSVGIFSGRSELGPRALGNRSILSDARDVHSRDLLNENVKKRETWRPFGPAVLDEDYTKFFEGNIKNKRFMNVSDRLRAKYRSLLPAIVHVDGSVRPQVVNKKEHSFLYSILCEFKKLTGIGILINTSFNIAGQPIIESPDDAIECFVNTGLNAVSFETHLIIKKHIHNC